MDIFDFDSYKKWVNSRIEALPSKGRGQYRRLSEKLRTNSTIIHQVFKGDRDLTPEQAILLSEYFGLTQAEQRFLLLLVNHSRAASAKYQQILKNEILESRRASKEIRNRVAQDFRLTEEAKAVVYSNWYYLAIWSLVAIEGYQSSESISSKLGLPRETIQNAIDKLLEFGLLILKQSKLSIGPALLHLEAFSPHIARHHQNWRLQAFRKYETLDPQNLFYTAPITLSEKTAEKIRQNVLKMIGETIELVKDSPSEKLVCLCIDWFEL